ncbi:MAG: hypothetical protein CM15mV13_1840 [uncultured marine virus]|nr:MAG: hypothetical protein CM15mV13_1840 [uncultured marine virus]
MIEEFIDFYVDIVKKAKKDNDWVNTMLDLMTRFIIVNSNVKIKRLKQF